MLEAKENFIIGQIKIKLIKKNQEYKMKIEKDN